MTTRESDTTARQHTADVLRDGPAIVPEFPTSIGALVSSVHDHLQRATRTVHGEDGEQSLITPPECEHCGFIIFDDPVNYPS